MEQNLKANADTKATRARLVMQALGLLPGSNGGMQEVDLSSIPKQVIVDVLRDLENALPEPDVALPKQQATPKKAKPPLEKVARPPQDHGGEHPRIAAVFLKAKPHRMVADQLANWPAEFAQRVALEIGRVPASQGTEIRAILDRSAL